MKNMNDNLKSETNWEEEYKKIKNKADQLEVLVKYYEEQLRLAKAKQFGKSSEKTEDVDQLGLFDEVENTSNKKESEPTVEEITYRRKKRVGKKDEDISNLPTETIEYTLPEDEQVCPECCEDLHVMSKVVRKEIVLIPAQVKVVEHVQNIYACRNCEENNDYTPIVKAKAPKPLIKGSSASASIVAHIMNEKYVNATPLYRLEQDFYRKDFDLSRQTMSNWLIRCTQDYLAPLYELMKTYLLREEVLHADETVVQVLHEPGRKASTNSYQWLYRTSESSEFNIVLYDYQPTRSSSNPKKFLSGFKGYLHTDGYSGYNQISDVIVIGCLAHFRRYYIDALKAIPEEERKGTQAGVGLEYCNKLFEMDNKLIKNCEEFDNHYEELHKMRLKFLKPLSDEFFAWANSINTLPKSALGKAITYTKQQHQYFENFFLDGRLEITNNRAERSIKPFVIGRKNWLFSNTQKGATTSSIIYSIIETAKENNLKPFEYLKYIFETLPNIKTSELSKLLPWSTDLATNCKVM